jgi:hypothetical protein
VAVSASVGQDPAEAAVFVQVATHLDPDGLVQAGQREPASMGAQRF